MAVHEDLLLADLVRFMHRQPEGSNVVDLVWLGREALADLDAHVAQLAKTAPADRVPTFEHGAFVKEAGWLILALVTERGGFAFRVAPGGWGWALRPA
jgi:hypothetical protein